MSNTFHTVNEAALLMLENLYFQRCILNVNKSDIIAYFSTLVCQLLLICFQVCVSKISAKSDKFVLN